MPFQGHFLPSVRGQELARTGHSIPLPKAGYFVSPAYRAKIGGLTAAKILMLNGVYTAVP